MTLEQYILKRKIEDGINEFDRLKRNENTRICVNYIFEFFNDYIDSAEVIDQTILQEDKIDKYRRQVEQYSLEIQNWLISQYAAQGKYMHRQLAGLIDDEYFLLYDSEAEFRSLSYKIYAKIIKKFKFMENQAEIIYEFLKDHHRLQSEPTEEQMIVQISDRIDEWISNTYKKYHVNILEFCEEYIDDFYQNPELWPKGSKHKSDFYDDGLELRKTGRMRIKDYLLWDYDFKWAVNSFNIDKLYRNMPQKAFTRNRKKDFLGVLMYYACQWEGAQDYWEEYISKMN